MILDAEQVPEPPGERIVPRRASGQMSFDPRVLLTAASTCSKAMACVVRVTWFVERSFLVGRR